MDPLLGQIMLFAGNFAPRGWAFCDGQLLSIAENSALFAILGTTYGGDGRVSFALPDLRGRVPVQQGMGPGLSSWRLGEKNGSEFNYLNITQLPAHTHPFSGTIQASSAAGTTSDPTNGYPAKAEQQISRSETNEHPVYSNTKNATMASDAVSGITANAGAGQPVDNIQPSLCLNYIIALEGVFPQRS